MLSALCLPRLMTVRLGLAIMLGVMLSFTGVTLVALEGREVVVLQTIGASGTVHETRTWVADEDGYAWIEAANPERPFLRDIATHPDIEMRRGDAMRQCHAIALPNPDGHERIRRLLARKYGWADWWIGMLTDTSRSSALQLTCY
jgi:hypothetical protein